jgi:hypothetical protein
MLDATGFQVDLKEDRLTISGRREQEKKEESDKWHYTERRCVWGGGLGRVKQCGTSHLTGRFGNLMDRSSTCQHVKLKGSVTRVRRRSARNGLQRDGVQGVRWPLAPSQISSWDPLDRCASVVLAVP